MGIFSDALRQGGGAFAGAHADALSRLGFNRLQKADAEAVVEISFHHLETSIDEHGALHFTRKFTEGVAPSWAVQVARSVGGEALARALG
jgi:hypothetical protein